MPHIVQSVQTALDFIASYVAFFFRIYGSERKNLNFHIWYKLNVGTLTSNSL